MSLLSGKAPDYKGKRIGLIFDGPNVVGTFDFFTCEDAFGKRRLRDVAIYSAMWDMSKSRSRQPLEFCYVEVIDYKENKTRLIERFGHGTLSEPKSLFADFQYCNMTEAVWNKCPESFRHAN